MQATASPPPVAPKALAQSLLELWKHVLKGSAGELYALLDELGLTITQVKALHALDGCVEEASVKEVSEHLGLSLPAASRTVEGLLQRGWVARREDEHDRRVKRVAITAGGRAVIARLDVARLQGLEAFAASLTPEQRATLHAAVADLPTGD